jgi:hypothetical protein
MKITLKNVILSFIIIFNLVIILSNFSSYEGLEIKISDSDKPNTQANDNETSKSTSDTSNSNETSNVSNSERPSNKLKANSGTPGSGSGSDSNQTPMY